MQNSKKVAISSEFITLGQLLKEEGIIPTGGAAKWFLRENEVKVNGESEARRGRKLRVGDQIEISGIENVEIVAE